jgi:Skp family chaperone for outer membrane proteins
MPRRVLALLSVFWPLAVAVLLVAGPVRSQPVQTAPSAVLTIDPERLFEQTAFGRRVIAESERRAEALQAENRTIEAELTAEERDLTERRPELGVDEFRALADDFDAKVDRIRAEQDAKAREIQAIRETGQQDFFNRIGPILLTIVRERQAAILLDRRTVFLSAEAVDITEQAVGRIDAEIGARAPEEQRGDAEPSEDAPAEPAPAEGGEND